MPYRLRAPALAKIIFKPHGIIPPFQQARHFYEKYQYDYKVVGMTEYQPIEVYSKHGYTLKGKWYKKPEHNKLIVLVHGYGGIAREMELIMPYFWKKGFDVVTYGIFAYGNKKAFITFGNHESDDLALLYDGILTEKRYQKVGMYGHSLGANTVLKAGNKVKRTPDFIIANAPFNRLDETIANHINLWTGSAHSIQHFLPLARQVIAYAERTWGDDLLPKEAMTATAKLQMPVLYLHGDIDSLNPSYMSEELAKRTPHSHRVLLPGADHLDTFVTTKHEINIAVTAFLEDNHIIKNHVHEYIRHRGEHEQDE